MRQRIADERPCGSNVSMRVPPCSFLACLRLPLASFIEKGGMPMFPASICAQPSPTLSSGTHTKQSPYQREQFLARTGPRLSRKLDYCQSLDMNKTPLNLRLWP